MEHEFNGVEIGKWRLGRRIGSGGLGDVFLACRIDNVVDQIAALKIQRDAHSPSDEAVVLRSLHHPNIVQLLDEGLTPDGSPFLVMEYFDGIAVTDYADEHGLSIRERLRMFLQACKAIAYLHQRPMAHLDLKPGNILVNREGAVKIIDFGNARQLESRGSGPPEAFSGPYASPEQIHGNLPTGQSADVYALGAVLYELLCGHAPFNPFLASSELHRQICDELPRPPSNAALAVKVRQIGGGKYFRLEPDRIARMRGFRKVAELRSALSGDIDRVCLFALRKNPARRYKAAVYFQRDIEMILDGKSPPSAKSGDPMFAALQKVRKWQAELAIAAAILGISLSGFITSREYTAASLSGRPQVRQYERVVEAALASMKGELRAKLVAETQHDGSLAVLDSAIKALDQYPKIVSRTDAPATDPEGHQ